MMRAVLWLAGDISISDRIMLLTYMGSPLQAALPFRHRIIARLLTLWLRFNPGAKGGGL